MIVVVMGVSGSGKSTIAAGLARALGWPFQDGDELHGHDAIERMKSGHALTDADRQPWLQAIADWLDERRAEGQSAITTCSALKRSYRRQLLAGRPDLRLLYLRAGEPVIEQRVARRRNHFMPASLVRSQFETLEEPDPEERAMVVDVDYRSPDQAVAEALRLLRSAASEQGDVSSGAAACQS